MISPPNGQSSSINRLRLALQFELMVALTITAVVMWLDVNYARHAGALWRDEVNSLSMATYQSLSTTWERLQFDSFPILWYLLLRGWVKVGLAQTDAGFRVFGLLINLAILGMLWLNAWRMSRRPPLVAVTLLGANAAIVVYCGSVRGYGLGLMFGLWMYGAVWAYLVRPTAVRWVVALIAAVLACHTLYYNCVFVAAACFGAATVAVWRRHWRVAIFALALGAVTAATLLIYVSTFRGSGEWRSMWVGPGGFEWLWFRFAQAVTLARVVMLPIWMVVPLFAVLGGFVTWARAKDSSQGAAVGQICPSGQADLALFAAISVAIGLMGNILFLRLLNYYMQPWYFLSAMAVVAAGADAAQRAASIGRARRIAVIALTAIVLVWILFSPLRIWSITRSTNVDEIARVVEQSAVNADYIVLADWTHGLTFNRYYRGSAPWQTLPPLPADAHDIHRSELVFRLIQRGDVIGPVLESIARTLHDGHRVFYIGHLPEQLPSERPQSYFAKRAEEHNPVMPVETWRYQLNYTIGELASHVTRIPINLKQPISYYEDLELFVFDGWRPSNVHTQN